MTLTRKTLIKLAIKNPGLMRNRYVLNMLRMAEYDGKKRMVIMLGPPASGKGFFLERGGKPGKGLPSSTGGLFEESHIPDDSLGVEESDNDLRAIQYEESRNHFNALSEAYAKGEEAFNKVLKDMWYKTKDGVVRQLSSFVSFNDFNPKDHKGFHTKQSSGFYKNMRGWHNDADEVNPETGKIKERFKDRARKKFEQDVLTKVNDGKDMLIVDSAGEDIDAQDFEGQIKAARAAGYEVTVIALDPEREDTKLANMNRGFVFGKRMVDDQDIDNYYDKYEKALEAIKKANPDNFLHYKKPPLDSETRARLEKLMTETSDGKPTFLKDPSSTIRSIKDLPAEDRSAVKKEVLGALFNKEVDYKLSMETSFSSAGMPGVPKRKPTKKTKNKVNSPGKDTKTKGTDWLDEKVTNPETGKKVKVRTLKNKPKGTEGHQYYKSLLEKIQQQKAAKLIAITKKVAYLHYSTPRIHKMAYSLQRDLKEISAEMMKEFPELEGYQVTVEPGQGPRIYVTLKGAGGDSTTSRKVKRKISDSIEKTIEDRFQGMLEHTIRGFNKGDDLVLEVTLLFP